jgi:hypothetical protein
MLLAEHGLDNDGVRQSLSPACQIGADLFLFSFSLGCSDREDVSGHRTIAARARKPSFLLLLVLFSFYFYFILFNLIFGRWIHISPKSTRDRRPSMSRAACRSTSRRACANGYAPALWVLCSSRTRISLAKAERGIIGRKAVRLFPFLSSSLLFVVFAAHVPHCPVYTDGMLTLILCGRLVNPRFSFPQALNSWIISW